MNNKELINNDESGKVDEEKLMGSLKKKIDIELDNIMKRKQVKSRTALQTFNKV